MNTIMKWAKSVPLEKMADPLSIIARRVNARRKNNQGFTPEPIFESCLSIGGVFPAVELLISVVDLKGKTIGVALKKRGEGDHDWTGKYHIPGVVMRKGDTYSFVLDRLMDEMYGSVKAKKGKHNSQIKSRDTATFAALKAASPVHIHMYYVKERGADCLSILLEIFIQSDALSHFKGTWKVFSSSKIDSPQIIGIHQKLLAWCGKKSRSWLNRN